MCVCVCVCVCVLKGVKREWRVGMLVGSFRKRFQLFGHTMVRIKSVGGGGGGGWLVLSEYKQT